MPQVQTDNVKPCNPFIDFTTTTSTTTLAPTLEYFLLPPSGSICPQDPCVCGSIIIPTGAKHNPDGSYISIDDNRYPLVHNVDALLDKEQQFISTTTKLIPPQNSINLLTNNVTINLGKELNLINVIQIVIKIRETKKIIGQNIIGSFDSSIGLSSINIPLLETFNLANLTLQIELISLCKNSKQVCCDALPSSVTLSNIINTIYCSTTTTLPPFCTNFNLPDTFYMTIVGYGLLGGQQHYNLVTRSGNTWYTSGTFPCGAGYYISMTCDSNTQSFIYDGYIDCCEESTKTIINPTSTPYLYPNAVSPLIISYTDCFCDLSCSTTTTTTSTTTDFPTTAPPPPPVPCQETSSLTINGYAFYRDNGGTVDIPGIGPLRIPCYGGHVCNRTDFIPQIITKTRTIEAGQISLNNSPGGGDRTQTFSFVIDDTSILSDGASVSLKCVNGFCHTGVTWVVLTTQINDKTSVLFNSCVLPNSIDSLDFECIDCCKWDGAGFIQFNSICDGLSKSLQFYKIGDNLWECDADIDCGDRVNMIVKCNKDIEFNAEAPNLDQLCKQKWEVVNFTFPCATNARLTGNLLVLCECDKPPIFELTADNVNNCDCCVKVGRKLGFSHNQLGNAPDGYPWTFVSTTEELYECKVLITSSVLETCGVQTLNTELSSSLSQWINDGGIFLYQEEWGPSCGNMNLANLAMNIAGSNMISEGGGWSGTDSVGGYTGISSNSPCVSGITFYGAFTAKISGGVPLVYAPDGDFPGAYTMMGEKIGNGHVILLGDINIVNYAEGLSLPAWEEFLRRLLTLPSDGIL